MRYSDQIIERMFFTGRGRETFPGLLAKWRQFPGKENGMRRPLCAVAICLVIAAAVWLESGGAERARQGGSDSGRLSALASAFPATVLKRLIPALMH